MTKLVPSTLRRRATPCWVFPTLRRWPPSPTSTAFPWSSTTPRPRGSGAAHRVGADIVINSATKFLAARHHHWRHHCGRGQVRLGRFRSLQEFHRAGPLLPRPFLTPRPLARWPLSSKAASRTARHRCAPLALSAPSCCCKALRPASAPGAALRECPGRCPAIWRSIRRRGSTIGAGVQRYYQRAQKVSAQRARRSGHLRHQGRLRSRKRS